MVDMLNDWMLESSKLQYCSGVNDSNYDRFGVVTIFHYEKIRGTR